MSELANLSHMWHISFLSAASNACQLVVSVTLYSGTARLCDCGL